MKITPWFSRLLPSPQSTRRRRFAARPQAAWVEILENRVLLSGQSVFAQSLATLPGTSFDDVTVQFDLAQGKATFAEMGVFQFDADGTVGGLTPGSEGFEEAVLNQSSRQTLFVQGTPTGSSASATFVGGSQIGIYLCQNTAPGVSQHEVRMTSANTLRIGFEEFPPLWPAVATPGTNARGLDDAVIQATLSQPVRFPVPILDPIAEQTIPEQQPFQLSIPAQNPAGPQSDLRYKLELAPDGVALDTMSGLLTWTPTEAQGPGRYDIAVRVFNVNRPESFSTVVFIINVTEVNAAPTINPIAAREVNQLEVLSFLVTATDPDRPVPPGTQRFTFSLVDNAIEGASIDPVTGRFTWTPTLDDVPATYLFTIRVVDSGSPALEDTEIFTVRVNPAVE